MLKGYRPRRESDTVYDRACRGLQLTMSLTARGKKDCRSRAVRIRVWPRQAPLRSTSSSLLFCYYHGPRRGIFADIYSHQSYYSSFLLLSVSSSPPKTPKCHLDTTHTSRHPFKSSPPSYPVCSVQYYCTITAQRIRKTWLATCNTDGRDTKFAADELGGANAAQAYRTIIDSAWVFWNEDVIC